MSAAQNQLISLFDRGTLANQVNPVGFTSIIPNQVQAVSASRQLVDLNFKTSLTDPFLNRRVSSISPNNAELGYQSKNLIA